MTNYIAQLEQSLAAAEAHKAALNREIEGLIAYLESSKFKCGDSLDGYVSTADVINRLRAGQHHAITEEGQAQPPKKVSAEGWAIVHWAYGSHPVAEVGFSRKSDAVNACVDYHPETGDHTHRYSPGFYEVGGQHLVMKVGLLEENGYSLEGTESAA